MPTDTPGLGEGLHFKSVILSQARFAKSLAAAFHHNMMPSSHSISTSSAKAAIGCEGDRPKSSQAQAR